MQTKRLEEWLDGIGISMQTDKARIRATDGGLGVFASKNINEGDELCSIPKAAVLSVKTSGIAHLLEENRIRGGLGLIIAILYEMSLHAASPWYELPTLCLMSCLLSMHLLVPEHAAYPCQCYRCGYLSELPSREYLPMFWTANELELLQGTIVAQNALVSYAQSAYKWLTFLSSCFPIE